MRKHKFFSLRRFLVLFPVLVVLLLAAGGLPGLAEAQEDQRTLGLRHGDNFACWASGPLGYADLGWGEENEFAVDAHDLGRNALLEKVTSSDYLTSPYAPAKEDGRQYYALFDTLPELVEYTFALDVLTATGSETSIEDKRVKLLYGLFSGTSAYTFAEDEDTRVLLPWAKGDSDALKKAYHARRSVGQYRLAVKSLNAEWIDPANPGGGRDVDLAAVALDQAAFQSELVEGTVTAASDGGIVHFGTTEGIAQRTIYQSGVNCVTGTCQESSNYVNDPVPIVLHTNIREQNDGQVDRNTTGADSRRITYYEGKDGDEKDVFVERDVDFDTGDIGPSGLMRRSGSGGGYSRVGQDDSESDVLHVVLELEDGGRWDSKYEPDKSNLGIDTRYLPAMGVGAWTYERFDTVPRAPDVNEWPAGQDKTTSPDVDLKHIGYRQPGLDRPAGADFASPPTGELARLTGGLGDRWDPRHIRWPSNLEDLNWYFYELPSGEKVRDSLWLYWLTKNGTQRVVYGGYGAEAVPFRPGPPEESEADQLPDCALVDSGDYEGVNTEAPLNLDDIECEDPAGWDWTYYASLNGAESASHLPFDVSDTRWTRSTSWGRSI